MLFFFGHAYLLTEPTFFRKYEDENCYNIKHMDNKIRSRKLLIYMYSPRDDKNRSKALFEIQPLQITLSFYSQQVSLLLSCIRHTTGSDLV